MPRHFPRALRLPLSAVVARDGLARHVARTLRPQASDLSRVVHAYAFKNDERAFAEALLARRTQLWLFRAHQGAACGDFLVVDLSEPDPARRRVVVLDLKQGAPLRPGGPGAFQMRNAALGLAELARAGVIAPDAPYEVLTGDRAAVLGHFGAAPP